MLLVIRDRYKIKNIFQTKSVVQIDVYGVIEGRDKKIGSPRSFEHAKRALMFKPYIMVPDKRP